MHFTTGDYAPVVRIDLDRFTHYSAYTTTLVGVDYRNVDTVDARLYRLPLEGCICWAADSSGRSGTPTRCRTLTRT